MDKNKKDAIVKEFIDGFKSLEKEDMKDVIEYVELSSDVDLVSKQGK
ncbi:hypothetical protein [Romboutsia lituseburensis]|uniref:Uncharacterized protein n=1 Tax=Romboutsia lituseburensis DSM 797 TaxID=1121325 RepID=A0A1G9MU05_9FIRM|nr:hypothetical protein [Romboutsia lituseburensis]CEH34315.1 Hypothetical protein RLITU_1726 [Romboutsia lituseburensis]SDL77762.1 hypothetical protein SAMN04515677_103359 [Romboutsia lituseburensis DSM 797]